MRERARHESAPGRAGGTGQFLPPEASPVPKKRKLSRGLEAEREGKLPGLERESTPRAKKAPPGKKK
jgi:hypothetical protein